MVENRGLDPGIFTFAQLQFVGELGTGLPTPLFITPSLRPPQRQASEHLVNICSVPSRVGRPTFLPGASLAQSPLGQRARWKCQHVGVAAGSGCRPSARFSVRLLTWYLDSEPRPPGTCWGDQSIRQHPETSLASGCQALAAPGFGRTEASVWVVSA